MADPSWNYSEKMYKDPPTVAMSTHQHLTVQYADLMQAYI